MWRGVVVAIGLVGFVALRHAAAQGFFTSSPGKLSSGHANLDDPGHCNDCHVSGTRDLSNASCLTCHQRDVLRAREPGVTRFHASSKVAAKPCQACHLEHKGVSFDIMGWKTVGGAGAFDHKLTGWPLEGAHTATACTACHVSKDRAGLTTYRQASPACSSCHAKDQPHHLVRPELQACERCHTETVWNPAKPPPLRAFDHDDRRDARMPLIGKHVGVACTKCHPKSVYRLPFPTPDSCGNAGCHNSPHDGQLFGARPCEWCHSPTFASFTQQVFEHTLHTRFDLLGHAKLACAKCHTVALGTAKPPRTCEGCHAGQSHHKDRFAQFGSPPRCGTCHPTTTWQPSAFDHASNTRFRLTGQHAAVACHACHRGTAPDDFERLPVDAGTQCKSCHTHAKVHADAAHPDGRFASSECVGCHVIGVATPHPPEALVDRFHGPQSRFPLINQHVGVPCARCHTGRDRAGKTSFGHVSPECATCHEDSLHRGSLGAGCASCHVSGIWVVAFPHDATFPADARGVVARFPLNGAHRETPCLACHPRRDFAAAAATCAAAGCHQSDDAHKGRLGDKCEQCHVETGDNIFNHNAMSAFRLDGKHLTVRCADCHPSTTFKPRPRDCFGCHPEPAVHRGQYGTGCARCHTTRTWEDVKPLHDVGEFSLKGMHDSIACERCHRDNRPLAGSGNLCINCHRQDDIHNNSLSPRCGECHTQWSFAPARFDHNKVGCNLTGLHRTMACFDCHRNGNFAGLSPNCVGCHHDDALRSPYDTAGNPAPPGMSNHAAMTVCASCHNQNTWTVVTMSPRRESVCR